MTLPEDDLGPEPTPVAEPPEPGPGGVDSEDDPRYGTTAGPPTTPDLRPERNPAVDDDVPDEVTEPDDKPQESPEDADDEGGASEPTA